MKRRKALGLITAVAVLASSFSGCALLGGKDKSAIEDAAISYVEAIRDGKLDKSKKLVEDEEDYFQSAELTDQQSELIGAILSASEFEVQDIEVNKDEGSASVVITMPDVESINEEGYTFEEYVDAIADIDETTEEEVNLDFVKDGEDWLIAADSTQDFYDFVTGVADSCEFGGLSEAGAIEAVDTFIQYLRDGDFESAYAMSNTDTEFEEFQEGMDTYGDAMESVMTSYYGNLEYTSEVTETTDDSITVSITGTAPDVESSIEAAFSDTNAAAPVMADVVGYSFLGDVSEEEAMNEFFQFIGSAIQTGNPIPYSSSLVVTADEAGNLLVDPADDFMFDTDFDISDYMDSEELQQATFQYLVDQGRMSQSDVDLLMGGGSSSVPTGDDVTINVVDYGDDLYSYNASLTTAGIELTVVTWGYYDEGTVFNYEVSVDGSDAAITGSYPMPDDMEDHIEILIPAFADDMSGNYVVTVYDADSSSSVLCKLELVVLGEGAPVVNVTPGDAPAFGESMTADEVSDDAYSFHFTDGNGNWLDDEDVYASNRGAVDFTARTWDYYDRGASSYCDVYVDGEYVDTIVATSSANNNDTFNFSYEPSSLADGDYVFVIHEVDDDGGLDEDVLFIAYATVETQN